MFAALKHPLALLFMAALLLCGPAAPACSDDLPYPLGESTHDIEGLKTWLHLPKDIAADKPQSLVIILHGYGGTASGMAGSMRAWVSAGYVICAPKSTGTGWDNADVAAVLKIGAHLKEVLPIDPKRVHVVGFSNGGWNLPPLAFDDDLRPCSATWVAAGYKGASVPKWAKKELGALALAGAQDGNLNAAKGTVTALQDKVRAVEVRVQPNLGHEWPEKLMPYCRWWMGAMEGRFTPGVDMNFAWGDDVSAALKTLEGKKKGGVFIYAYDENDADSALAKQLQNELYMDPLVRHYGKQLQAVKLAADLGTAPETQGAKNLAALRAYGAKCKELPCVLVLDRNGKLKKELSGKIKARKLASALKSVSPNKKPPE